MPIMAPCVRTASSVNSEQVGVKRHEPSGPNSTFFSGERNSR